MSVRMTMDFLGSKTKHGLDYLGFSIGILIFFASSLVGSDCIYSFHSVGSHCVPFTDYKSIRVVNCSNGDRYDVCCNEYRKQFNIQ